MAEETGRGLECLAATLGIGVCAMALYLASNTGRTSYVAPPPHLEPGDDLPVKTQPVPPASRRRLVKNLEGIAYELASRDGKLFVVLDDKEYPVRSTEGSQEAPKMSAKGEFFLMSNARGVSRIMRYDGFDAKGGELSFTDPGTGTYRCVYDKGASWGQHGGGSIVVSGTEHKFWLFEGAFGMDLDADGSYVDGNTRFVEEDGKEFR